MARRCARWHVGGDHLLEERRACGGREAARELRPVDRDGGDLRRLAGGEPPEQRDTCFGIDARDSATAQAIAAARCGGEADLGPRTPVDRECGQAAVTAIM